MEKPKFEFYERQNGHIEFEEFLRNLSTNDRATMLATIQKVENYGLIRAGQAELVKSLGNGIYELRSKFGHNIQRGLYFHQIENTYLITHGFTKKTQKTPNREIKHAKKLRQEYLDQLAKQKKGTSR